MGVRILPNHDENPNEGVMSIKLRYRDHEGAKAGTARRRRRWRRRGGRRNTGMHGRRVRRDQMFPPGGMLYSRSTAKTVVVGDGLDATGTGHGHVTALVPKVDSDHGHRSHDCGSGWLVSSLTVGTSESTPPAYDTRDGNTSGAAALVDTRCYSSTLVVGGTSSSLSSTSSSSPRTSRIA